MIVKIFPPRSAFTSVRYNTGKIDRGLGELMKVSGFGPLMAYGEKRPEDYRQYLEMIAATNKRVKKPTFHAAISAEGKSHTKEQLTGIAEKWLQAMGYGEQPFLIVFHKDTENNHVHLVSVRVNREGQKINSGFEHIRAVGELNKIIGLDESVTAQKDVNDALKYHFASRPQFALILEKSGYSVKEKDGVLELIKFGHVQAKVTVRRVDLRISQYQPDKQRAQQLRDIFNKYLQQYNAQDLAVFLKKTLGISLVFHAAAGKAPYGYSVIDHTQQRVFKGGEIMPLRELLDSVPTRTPDKNVRSPDDKTSAYYEPLLKAAAQNYGTLADGLLNQGLELEETAEGILLTDKKENVSFGFSPQQISVWIADDVDDQQIHGPRRRRQKKARTNTR